MAIDWTPPEKPAAPTNPLNHQPDVNQALKFSNLEKDEEIRELSGKLSEIEDIVADMEGHTKDPTFSRYVRQLRHVVPYGRQSKNRTIGTGKYGS